MSDNPSTVPIQCPQYNSAQTAQVSIVDSDARYSLDYSLSYISLQPLGGLDHELGSTEHLLGIKSTGPHPAMNHPNALPPARYPGNMWYDDPPHPATVSVRLPITLRASFVNGGFAEAPRRISRELIST